MELFVSRIVLAIDTATPAVTAGIVADGNLLAERVNVDARAHAERLTPNVLGALADAGLRMADLHAVVVGCGPGPFTGLRVGMATAAAYGHALDVPAGARSTGLAIATASESTDRPSTPRPMSTPVSRARSPARPSMRRCSGCRCANRRTRHRPGW
jgi:tRNA threonylcarbamoyl adenosine modification protein YeaZ